MNQKDANKLVTLSTSFLSAAVALYKNSLVGCMWILLVMLFLPMIYTLFMFSMSECYNKAAIVDSGFYEDDVMLFMDHRKNCRLGDFLDEMQQNANFYVSSIAMLIAIFC